jgi:hypothetical protein
MPSNAAIDSSQVQWDSAPAAPAPASSAIDTSKVQWDAPAPQQTWGGAGQAVGSGLNAGIADIAGLPVDTARNVLELGKAGFGTAIGQLTKTYTPAAGETLTADGRATVTPGGLYHFRDPSTGADRFSKDAPPEGATPILSERPGSIPSALQPLEDRSVDVGSSDWIKSKMRNILGGSSVDVQQPTTLNRYLHAGSEVVPSALAGNKGGTVGALRAAGAGAAAGVAQQAAGDAGASPGTQAAVGFLAGAAAGRATQPRAAAAPAPTPQNVKPAAFEPAPTAPGEAPRLNIGGTTTAADALKSGTPLPEIAAPVADPATLPVATDAEQATRAQTLRDIGLKEARESAITGDAKETGTDYQTGKLDGAAGDRMTGVINGERAALQNYAGQIADSTGGSRGMDQADLYNRGNVIAKPVEQLGDYFDSKIKDAYAATDANTQGMPLDLPTTGNFLQSERASFLGTVEGKQLREGVLTRMRDLGMMDQDGNVQQATVKQAEQLRQYLGDQWTPRTSRLIGKMKDAIDDDVTRAAGSDIYASARATRARERRERFAQRSSMTLQALRSWRPRMIGSASIEPYRSNRCPTT